MIARWRSLVHAPVVALLLLAIGTTTRAGVLGRAARELSERLAVPAREAAGKFARAPKPLGIHHGGDPVRLLHLPGAPVRPLTTKLGPGAKQVVPVLSPRNARRLAILAKDGTLTRTGRTDELMAVIARHGDRALNFVWRHKGALTVTTVLAAFLADPEPFLDGSRRLARDAATTVARPVTGWIGGTLGRLAPDARRLLLVVLTFLTTVTLALVFGRRRPTRPGPPP
jgi:hypothetical protein